MLRDCNAMYVHDTPDAISVGENVRVREEF